MTYVYSVRQIKCAYVCIYSATAATPQAAAQPRPGQTQMLGTFIYRWTNCVTKDDIDSLVCTVQLMQKTNMMTFIFFSKSSAVV